MATTHETDVAIIGAGIIGVATAFELAKRGYRTLNVDRLPTSGYGPTSNSCAIVRAHYSTAQGVAMAFESFHYWSDWDNYVGVRDESGMARYVDTGVVLIKNPSGHYRKVLEHYDALGVPYEEWTPAQLTERYPMFSTRAWWPPKHPDDPSFWDEPDDEIEGALFTPGGGFVVDPLLASHNLQVAVQEHGGRFLFKQTVTEILQDGGHVTGLKLASGDQVRAEVVINVAGPHSSVINRMAGVEDEMNVKTRALRHEVHQVPAPPGVDFENDGVMTSDGDSGIYFRPGGGNNIIVGSEDPECDTRVWVDDPDHYERGITRAQWEAQVFRLARRMPALRIPNERRGVTDLYDVADDWIPIYDQSSLGGFYMAIGTSGNQFKNAPIAGLLMAELIARVEDGHDQDAEPIRVVAPYTGAEIDSAFYSRLRQINPQSSFSVAG